MNEKNLKRESRACAIGANGLSAKGRKRRKSRNELLNKPENHIVLNLWRRSARQQDDLGVSDSGTALNREDDPDAFDACIKELDEIGNKHVQVEVPNIKLDDLRDAKFTIAEMEALSLLISQ